MSWLNLDVQQNKLDGEIDLLGCGPHLIEDSRQVDANDGLQLDDVSRCEGLDLGVR
ncbi:MAG: hypothetical protein WAP47_03315 [Candidatus Rokuibacteriota bacterium]